MLTKEEIKPGTFAEFWEKLPPNEQLIIDVLRQIILEHLPKSCKEKFSYHVPCYYGKKNICLLWPASVPRGGFKNGVLLGFVQGYLLQDKYAYLDHGTNKKVFYKIFKTVEEIDQDAIVTLLKEAVELDCKFK